LAFGLSVAGLGILPTGIVVGLVAGGAVAMTAYVLHARRVPVPVLDFSLVRLPTFRANVIGGSLFRMGIGALSFLLPLLLQLGFHMSPLQSGLITFTSAVGAFAMKAFAGRIIRRVGFRKLLIFNALISAAFTALCATFTPATPFAVMIGILLVGGFFRSLQFTATNTIAYADVAPQRMSRATSLVSVAQQLSISAGIAIGALAVELAAQSHGGTGVTAADFQPAFLVVSAIAASSVIVFLTLPHDAGAQLANRVPLAAPDASDQRVG